MPGYYYGGGESGYYRLQSSATHKTMTVDFDAGGPYYIVSKSSDESVIKKYRSFMIGAGGEGSPTTETGNNEHSKKY